MFIINCEQVANADAEWKNWDLRPQNRDIRQFPPSFSPSTLNCSFSGEINLNLENANNRTNLWVMTHDFEKSEAEIVAFPLRICWISWFANKNQNISGIHSFCHQKRENSLIFGISTLNQSVSGNETILGKLIENVLKYGRQSELNLISAAKMKRFFQCFKFSTEMSAFLDFAKNYVDFFQYFWKQVIKNYSTNYHCDLFQHAQNTAK